MPHVDNDKRKAYQKAYYEKTKEKNTNANMIEENRNVNNVGEVRYANMTE